VGHRSGSTRRRPSRHRAPRGPGPHGARPDVARPRRTRRPRAVPALVPLLGDPDPEVASTAAFALGRIGGPDALSAAGPCTAGIFIAPGREASGRSVWK
jgi:hypothetical protein